MGASTKGREFRERDLDDEIVALKKDHTRLQEVFDLFVDFDGPLAHIEVAGSGRRGVGEVGVEGEEDLIGLLTEGEGVLGNDGKHVEVLEEGDLGVEYRGYLCQLQGFVNCR